MSKPADTWNIANELRPDGFMQRFVLKSTAIVERYQHLPLRSAIEKLRGIVTMSLISRFRGLHVAYYTLARAVPTALKFRETPAVYSLACKVL
jgi:hypothetical protein